MAQRVRADGFLDSRRHGCLADGALDDAFVQMVAGTSWLAGSVYVRVAGKTHCQIHSRGALGYLRSIASGSATAPAPRLISPSIGANLGLGHGFGMAFAVKENQPADPSDVP
jgi:hypothetical protein